MRTKTVLAAAALSAITACHVDLTVQQPPTESPPPTPVAYGDQAYTSPWGITVLDAGGTSEYTYAKLRVQYYGNNTSTHIDNSLRFVLVTKNGVRYERAPRRQDLFDVQLMSGGHIEEYVYWHTPIETGLRMIVDRSAWLFVIESVWMELGPAE